MNDKTGPQIVSQPKRPPPVLMCRKCLKRTTDGKAIKRALKDELKSSGKQNGTKPARLVTTSCFGLCPKRAVTVAGGATLVRGEYLVVRDATEAAAAVRLLTRSQTSDD